MEHAFSITVQPCQIDFVDSLSQVADIVYHIGDAGQTSSSYEFAQLPLCGYTQEISVSGLPAFVEHDEQGRNFVVKETTDASAFVGVHQVTITCSVEVPVDYTKQAFVTVTGSQTFKITVEPCQIDKITLKSQGSGDTVINYNFFNAPELSRTYSYT